MREPAFGLPGERSEVTNRRWYTGQSTVENIELRCRTHNQREAVLFFGGAMPSVVREWAIPYETGSGPCSSAVERAEPFEAPGFEQTSGHA